MDILDPYRHKVVWYEQGEIAHIDRSELTDVLTGISDAYVSYMTLASATGLVLSRSYFGDTAAELGGVSDVYFFEGCVRMDTTSS